MALDIAVPFIQNAYLMVVFYRKSEENLYIFFNMKGFMF